MTAIQILEWQLSEQIKTRKLFYRRKKRTGKDKWLDDELIKFNKERTKTISDIRRTLKILNHITII